MKDNERMNMKQFLSKYDLVLIPDIQRDYVMGSGEEYLKSLLDDMNKLIVNNEEAEDGQQDSFDFGCIMGYSENIREDNKGNVFYVYDGQQRLTTLICLLSYLCELNDGTYKLLTKNRVCKYQFSEREEANLYINNLLNNAIEKINVDISDFTLYSLKNLLFDSTYGFIKNQGKITKDFLLNQVVFNIVSLDEQGEEKKGDAEQFFLDLNDGVDLKDYEIYKAELNHRVSTMKQRDEAIVNWALRVDNEWLYYFLKHKSSNICEEKLEMRFIQYCFYMRYIEKNGSSNGWNKKDISWIKEEDITRVYNVINRFIEYKEIQVDNDWINYSWKNSCDKYRGAYWNLANNNYAGIIKEFIKALEDEIYVESQKRDVLFWCIISSLYLEQNERNFHLRFIKKLLNHNRVTNQKAYFSSDYKIYFSRYCVYGIPIYYGKNLDNFCPQRYDYTNYCYYQLPRENWDESKDKFLEDVVRLNGVLLDTIFHTKSQYFENMSNIVSEHIFDELINNLLINEILKYEANKDDDEYKNLSEIEDKEYFNGLIENMLNDNYKIPGNIIEKSKHKTNELYEELSLMKIPKFSDILYDDIDLYWPVYDGREINQPNCSIIFQQKVDFFTCDCEDKNLKKVFDKWIRSELYSEECNEELSFYLQNYHYLPKGCFYGNQQICYPRTDNDGKHFITKLGAKKMGKSLLEIIPSCRDVYENSGKRIYIDEHGNLMYNVVPIKSSWSNDGVPYCITYNKNWIEELLSDSKYSMGIWYYQDAWMRRILIVKYIKTNISENSKFIEDCSKKKYDAVIPVDTRTIFISSEDCNSFLRFEKKFS